MADYRAADKTEWFIKAMQFGWWSRKEIVALSAIEFPGVPSRTLDGTIGQYWSDCVNPKWSTYQAIRKRGLKVVQTDGKRRIVADSVPAPEAAPPESRCATKVSVLATDTMSAAPTPSRALVIDEDFINEWHPKYELTEDDEPEYGRLVDTVARDMQGLGTISRETFLAIWRWKGAMRVISQVRMDVYESRYAGAFRRAASVTPERRLAALIAPDVKLPGLGAPTASTILHFMHPKTMPIIDKRTVEVLSAAGLVSTKLRDLAHYEDFRQAIESIRRMCPNWSLRQIDRALFAYHKQVLDAGTAT